VFTPRGAFAGRATQSRSFRVSLARGSLYLGIRRKTGRVKSSSLKLLKYGISWRRPCKGLHIRNQSNIIRRGRDPSKTSSMRRSGGGYVMQGTHAFRTRSRKPCRMGFRRRHKGHDLSKSNRRGLHRRTWTKLLHGRTTPPGLTHAGTQNVWSHEQEGL
jgi:hypothetical protein